MKQKPFLLSAVAFVLCILMTAGCIRVGADPDTPQKNETPAVTEAAEPTPEPTPTPTPVPTPEPTPTYDLNFAVSGQQMSPELGTLDLSQATPEEVDRVISVLPALGALRTVELGSAAAESPVISWEQIRQLHEGAPQAELHYSFTVRGYPFSLSDQVLNLNHLSFDDEGALVSQIAACMPNLRVLDMDCCGVSNESMAVIRDRFPNVNVVWRVWIGNDYSTRTDETRLVISNPDRGGNLNTPESIAGLFYCTKVKYLDLGHNYLMTDISFVRNMPDLEALIIAMTAIKDISPLADCKKLNYLEYQTSAACDLSPLAELPVLKDLNICYNFALRDIRPIYGLDLDRLFIGYLSPVPPEQIEEYRQLHPNCIVNDFTEDPTARGWRILDEYYPPVYAPRYEQLRIEMNYDDFPGCYAYVGNDPKEFNRFEYDLTTLTPITPGPAW